MSKTNWRTYCTVCLFKPDIPEDKILSKIDVYKKFLEKNVPNIELSSLKNNFDINSESEEFHLNKEQIDDSKNVAISYKGKRRLTYAIKKYTDSYFCEFYFSGNGSLVNVLLKYLRLDDDIIRQQINLLD